MENISLPLNVTEPDYVDSSGDEDSDCGGGFSYNVSIITLFIFGSIGNITAIIVFRRPTLRRRPGAPALTCLVIFNTLGLFFNALSSVDDINSNYNGSIEEHVGPIGCKLLRFVPACIQLMGHWVVVYITSQRFVAICVPRAEGAFFRDCNAKIVFSSMFFVLAATQLWRPYLDTQEPPTYRNSSNGTLIQETPAMCTAEQLGVYIDIESFFYQLGMLFFFPAVLILVMNAAVIAKLYQDYHVNKSLKSVDAVKLRQSVRRRFTIVATDTSSAFLSEMETLNGTAPLEKKLRKATIVLLAVTCTFWLYIMPQLLLLLYVRFNEIIYSRLEGYNAFLRVCKALNVTSIVATISSADYLIIQLIFDDMFRLELKFIVYRLFGKCSLHCLYLYIRERQLQRGRIDGLGFHAETMIRSDNPLMRQISPTLAIVGLSSPTSESHSPPTRPNVERVRFNLAPAIDHATITNNNNNINHNDNTCWRETSA